MLHKTQLRQEISLILVVKIALLFLIWYLLIMPNKVPHDAPQTAQHFLQEGK